MVRILAIRIDRGSVILARIEEAQIDIRIPPLLVARAPKNQLLCPLALRAIAM